MMTAHHPPRKPTLGRFVPLTLLLTVVSTFMGSTATFASLPAPKDLTVDENPSATALPGVPPLEHASTEDRARELCRLANAAARRGEHAAARNYFQKALEVQPGFPLATFGLGLIAAAEEDFPEAIRWFQATLSQEPDHSLAHFNLATSFALQDHLTDAIPHFERVLELDPDDASARRHLVKVHLQLAQAAEVEGPQALDRAIVHYRAAAATDPSQAITHLSLGSALGRSQQFVAAAESYHQAVERAPLDTNAHLGRATALLLAKRFGDARGAIEDSLERLRDEDAESIRLSLRHALARLLASCPVDTVRDGEKALELSLQVFERRPGLEHGQTVAMAYAELGRFDMALHWQEKMLQEIERRGEDEALPAARERLALYADGEAYRDP